MATMKAVQIHRYGEPEVLVYEDAPIPAIQSGQVLVQVHAAGVNPVDWKTRRGSGVAGGLGEHPFPLILGWDISGVVVEVADDVQTFAIGDNVYGMVNFPNRGVAYAEYGAASVVELARKPANLSHEEAAALPLAGLTAWQGLFTNGNLEAGQTVLIQAGAGGVGHLAVQLAKWKGAHVIATASGKNVGFVRGLGADEVIDYRTTPLEDAIHDVDLVIEGVGAATLTSSIGLVKSGGKVISIVAYPTEEQKALAHTAGVHLQRPMVYANATDLSAISELVAAGIVRPVVGATFPLSEAARAHELSETGHARGKIVLRVV